MVNGSWLGTARACQPDMCGAEGYQATIHASVEYDPSLSKLQSTLQLVGLCGEIAQDGNAINIKATMNYILFRQKLHGFSCLLVCFIVSHCLSEFVIAGSLELMLCILL